MSDQIHSLVAVLREDQRLTQKLKDAKTRDEALEAAILAAENALKALSLAQRPDEKAQFRARAKELMSEAESIKKNLAWQPKNDPSLDGGNDTTNASRISPISGVAKVPKEPRSTRALTTREKIILARATFLNGTKFPMWESPPSATEFELPGGGVPFVCVLPLRASRIWLADEIFLAKR
jgi:hypothetical protein